MLDVRKIEAALIYGLKLRKCHDTHYQIVSAFGNPIVDIWPTRNKFRVFGSSGKARVGNESDIVTRALDAAALKFNRAADAIEGQRPGQNVRTGQLKYVLTIICEATSLESADALQAAVIAAMKANNCPGKVRINADSPIMVPPTDYGVSNARSKSARHLLQLCRERLGFSQAPLDRALAEEISRLLNASGASESD